MEEDTMHSQYDGNNEDVMFENNSMDITDKQHVRTHNTNEYITEANQYQDKFGNQNYNNKNKNNYQQNINDNFVNNDYSQSLQ